MERIMAYPFSGYGVAGIFDPKSKEEVYSTALQNILTTPKGSLPYAPDFGSVIPLFPFDLNDDITRHLIQYYAFRDLREQEPRLRIVGLDADFDVDNYLISFTVAFIAYDDPTETTRTAALGPIPASPFSAAA